MGGAEGHTKHEQLYAALRARITGAMRPGDLIPSERRLTEEYGVSRITVRQAVGRLEIDGLLARVQGKGTFVASGSVQSTLHLASFSQEMRTLGRVPTTVVLSREESLPPPPVAREFALAEGASAFRVVRLRLADGVPVSVDDSWLSPGAFPDLLTHDLSGSLYALARDHYGRPIDRARQTIWADRAGEQQATWLGISTGDPVLVFDRLAAAGFDTVESTRTRYRSDRYRVRMDVAAEDAPQTRRSAAAPS